MHELLRVWRRIEALPVAAGVDADWKELLGGDLRFLEPYLKPEQQLATSYLCPHPVHDNCPRRVVHHGPDDIVAVCGNASPWCEPLKLTRRDLVVRSLKTKEWIAAVVKELRDANGLEALDLDLPEGVVALGTLARRGRRVAVVWVRREVDDVENLARGIRATLEGADLVVMLPPSVHRATDGLVAGAGIVLLAPPNVDEGRLKLYRALDLLDPRYRERRVEDPTAIFDDVTVEFAEEPGVRHVVKINGQEYGGFQRSDIKFARLLLLAAARAAEPNIDDGGWIDKSRLRGGEDRDRDLEKLRNELYEHQHPGLTPEEMRALIKSKRGSGEIRLAVPPTNICFDDSLRRFEFISASQTKSKQPKKRRTPGMEDLGRNLADGFANARLLLKDARRLGVPDEEQAAQEAPHPWHGGPRAQPRGRLRQRSPA
ncbi:MAG: hypothetical protein HY698_17835, partial [Deltaproteobacteria bacterium]|nr:hypothetical protein [Deltaproteobacteria bacterium]